MSALVTPTHSMSLRDFLRAELMEVRGERFPGKRLQLRCPICLKLIPISEIPPMHEALITRGDVQGHPLADRIMNRYNCVLPHNRCHERIIGHGGDKVFEACARHLVLKESYYGVHSWLQIQESVFTDAGTKALRRFEGLGLENE